MTTATNCIVFDVFGTLYHYDRRIFTREFNQTHSVLKGYGIELSIEKFTDLWKNTFLEKLMQARETHNEFSLLSHSLAFLEIISVKHKNQYIIARDLSTTFISEWLKEVTINPFAEKLLGELSKKNILIAISNINDTRVTHDLFFKDQVSHYFSIILCSGVTGKRKPSPDMINYAIRFLNVETLPVIIVGDNEMEDSTLASKMNAAYIEIALPAKVDPYNSKVYDKLKDFS